MKQEENKQLQDSLWMNCMLKHCAHTTVCYALLACTLDTGATWIMTLTRIFTFHLQWGDIYTHELL